MIKNNQTTNTLPLGLFWRLARTSRAWRVFWSSADSFSMTPSVRTRILFLPWLHHRYYRLRNRLRYLWVHMRMRLAAPTGTTCLRITVDQLFYILLTEYIIIMMARCSFTVVGNKASAMLLIRSTCVRCS